MIGYLKGKVKYLAPEYVLLEVGGVGYEVVCSGAAFSRLSGVKTGEDGEVYTYLQVKEDGIALFGFADVQEKSLFKSKPQFGIRYNHIWIPSRDHSVA